MMGRLRVGVVGLGAIGATVARAIDDDTIDADLVGVREVDDDRAKTVMASLRAAPPLLDLDSLAGTADVVVEAVSKAVAPSVIEASLRHDADVLVLSVGALLDRGDLVALARERGRTIHVPTGAVAGLDAVRAAAVAGLDSVTLTTTKPPRGLAGAPYVVEHQVDLDALTEPTVLFEGSAAEAVAAFPANVNVAAALSLAGLGSEGTRVRVVADPTAATNRHEIEVRGASGRVSIAVDNVPSPDNPKTSYLAALSAIALLRRLSAPLVVGS